MPIQPLTSIETEHTRFLYQSAYTPLSQQPYLLSTPFIEADTFPLGSVFFLVFDSPSADVQAEFASGVRRSLTFRMAGGVAVTAPVSCVSFLSGQTLYVAFTLLATIFLLPTPHLLQGASSMVFLPRDGSDAPVESVYANNGVGQVPLAGGTTITTSDNKVTAPAMVQVTNFPSGGSAITASDGALASVGNTADTAYVSGAGTMIAILKAIFLKLAGTLGVNVANWPSSQTVSGSVSVSNLPSTQAVTGTDGSQATIGTTTDTTSATTLVGLLKSIKSALLGTLTASVSGSVAITNFPATQAESIVDGSDVTQGAKADSAATDSTSSWSIVALLKGVYAKLASSLSFIQPDVTTTGTITAAQPSIGTTVTGGYVTLAVGNGQSSWKAQLTGLTATDVIVVDHSSDGGTTWNSSNFTVAGAAVNTPVASVTAISGALELAGNDSSVSHIKVRCTTYNSGDTIGVTIRAGFGIGRVGIITPLPAGGNNIGLVSNDATFAKETGGNLASLVTLLTNPANPGYEYNSGGPGGGTVDRVKNVQGKGPVVSATIATSGATVGQNTVTLNSNPPASLMVGMQIELIGGTQENAYVASLSGTAVTLTSPIVNSGHTSIQWDSYAMNGPLGNLMTAMGMGIRALGLYKSSASATTPYVQAQADANNNLLVGSPDGAVVTIGAKADATTNDTTSAWSITSLLKGIYAKVAGTIAVSGTFWQATQPTSIADGSSSTLGAKADSAITDSTTTNTQMSFMKGFVKILADVWDSTNHLFHFNLKQIGGTAVGASNPLPVDGAAQQGPINITVAGGASSGTTPNFTGTCTANQDNLITFASKVRTVELHNQSAVNVPYEHDLVATAVSAYLAPGQLVYVDIHTTNLHVFPPNALPINAASGLIVRGYA